MLSIILLNVILMMSVVHYAEVHYAERYAALPTGLGCRLLVVEKRTSLKYSNIDYQRKKLNGTGPGAFAIKHFTLSVA
jgi:hypothetical protein